MAKKTPTTPNPSSGRRGKLASLDKGRKGGILEIDVLTLFPEMIDAYCGLSILGRAQKSKLLKVKAHDLRHWAIDKHGHVDDRPFGGGAGMLMRVEPFYKALKQLHVIPAKAGIQKNKSKQNSDGSLSSALGLHRDDKKKKTRVILTSAKGKIFTQQDAQRLAKYDRLVFLCGRYEGVDERVADKLADEELSIGQYVLTGGELAALVMADAVTRLRPGVLGKQESLHEESWTDGQAKEYPQYTRPEVFFTKGESASAGNRWEVPTVLLSGDHKKIAEWRRKHQG